MKRIVVIPLITVLMACLLFPDFLMAGNKISHTVSMQKEPKREFDPNMNLDPEGRRSPSMLLYCIISNDKGVSIVGLHEDIISYEIGDPSNGITLASFSEEQNFLDYLFSQVGDFQIKFETENYHVFGYISLD